ncbi:MAG TPA: hypothetical protein VGI20_08190 [Rhizomicrobium sp.]|jgi:hypothetical protein
MCARLSIVPEPNDYKIVTAGYPFYISDRGAEHPKRLGVLELTRGQFEFHIKVGNALTPDLQARVDARLALFQKAMSTTH